LRQRTEYSETKKAHKEPRLHLQNRFYAVLYFQKCITCAAACADIENPIKFLLFNLLSRRFVVEKFRNITLLLCINSQPSMAAGAAVVDPTK
jgi:hypothetical protein